MVVLIVLYISIIAFRYWLLSLNLTYLKEHGKSVPREFADVVDPHRLQKITDYTLENSTVGIVESIFRNIMIFFFFFGGVLGIYDNWIASLTDSLPVGGLFFFLFLFYLETFLDIPFSLYKNFKIENKYGFNTMTFRLWLVDLTKTVIISTVLGCVVIGIALAIVIASAHWWWLWVWLFFLAFGIFIMYLSPYVIEPLFFKFEPVKAEGLEERVRALMERAGLKVSRVFQVDASRRSRHSNAYFTGIGKVKRIILFDTLIEQMSQDEIIAVLAHEVGHWKKRHVLKSIFLSQTLAFGGLFMAFRLISWDGLPQLMRLTTASFYARVAIAGFIGSLVMFPLTPLFSFISRRNENEADKFATGLTGCPETLASALIKLSNENLTNLHPHPFYAKFYYSHPPVVERIRRLMTEDGRQH